MANSSLKANLKHSLKLALIFQVAWAVVAIIALQAGATVGVSLILMMMLVLWVPALLELITRTRFPTALQVHFYVFITLSSVAGSAFGMYGIIPNWDTWVHIDSGILLAWLGLFAVQCASESAKAHIPRWFVLSAAFATPMAFAALWEISEFLSDTYLHTTTQAGLEDTIVDMIAAVVGAMIAILLVMWFKAPKSLLPRL